MKAFIVPKPGQKIDAEQVIVFCRERLVGYKVPRRVESHDALPKAGMGKYSVAIFAAKSPKLGR